MDETTFKEKVKIGDTITYDLLMSTSSLDRRKGKFLYHSGESHISEGRVEHIGDGYILISGRSFTDRKRVPVEAIV